MNIDEFILQNGEKCVLSAVKESLLRKAERLKSNQYAAYWVSASKSVQEAIDVLSELYSYFDEFRKCSINEEMINILTKEFEKNTPEVIAENELKATITLNLNHPCWKINE